MNVYKWISCVVGVWAFVFPEVGMSQTAESVCVVKLFDQTDFKGQVRVKWTSELVTTFELTGSDKWLSSGPVKLPAVVKEVQIEGSLAWKHYQEGNQKSSGTSKDSFVDFTPAIRPLRSQESWGKRMDKLVKELVKLEKQQEDRGDSPSENIESSGPVPPAEIKVAEQRLKFALPEEHKQLLQDYGAWSYSDSYCVASAALERADKQMLAIWGSPASEFASLSATNKALYQASVMLYVEAGDGYGALIYHPTTAGGEYYWIHQDDLDRPAKLVDSQGKPRDYSSTMRWLIANQILMFYEDAFFGTFIDRSSPTALPYELRLDFPAPKQPRQPRALEARLTVDWNKFE